MRLRVAIPDMVSPSYFPAIAAVELGFFAKEGLDAGVELIFPVTKTFDELREGRVDFAGGAAHAALYAFRDWRGCRLLCALSQHMYWFLVVRSDLEAKRGDLRALKGLRIGAAPGPVDGLKRMLADAGIDADREVKIGPVAGSAGAGVSFGMAAARALEEGAIDGFWANGMGAEVAVRGGFGTLLIDARRGDGPRAARDYTFAALVATQERVGGSPGTAASAARAVAAAQRALKADPSLAARAAKKLFPRTELDLIPELVRRDAQYYDALISPASFLALNGFARTLGLLSREPAYEEVVLST
ncbi:MAG TPA: ABC transporter substrate-binding protein [Burkholderiales bacterium]|nr:ABC transporter substrate-binding protein [Burkholderiales bacterium]